MERMAVQLAGDAADHGDRVVIASGPGAWADKVTAAGAEHFLLPTTSRGAVAGLAAATARLAQCIRWLRPHVVHSHNVRATALARLSLLAAHQRAALVPTLHGVDPRDYGAASRVLSRTARRVIACAPAVARSLQAAGFPGDRIDVITNGAALRPADLERQADLRQSLTLLEALSLGAPVVATAVDGITDLVPPEAALLVPPEDPVAVSTAVSRILTDDDLAASLRGAALDAAQAWRPERMLSQYRSAYRAAADGKPRWV